MKLTSAPAVRAAGAWSLAGMANPQEGSDRGRSRCRPSGLGTGTSSGGPCKVRAPAPVTVRCHGKTVQARQEEPPDAVFTTQPGQTCVLTAK